MKLDNNNNICVSEYNSITNNETFYLPNTIRNTLNLLFYIKYVPFISLVSDGKGFLS